MKTTFAILAGLIFVASAQAQTLDLQGKWLGDSGVCLKADGSQEVFFKFDLSQRPMTESRLRLDSNGMGTSTITNYGPSSQCSGTSSIQITIQGDQMTTVTGPVVWSGDLSQGCEDSQSGSTDTVRFTVLDENSFQVHIGSFGQGDPCVDRWLNFIRN